jgi:AsmA family protein
MRIRCKCKKRGVATFDVKDGDASVARLVFDTDVVRIHGDGDIKLGPEALALDIEGQPKKFRLLRLKTPIAINGTLRKPTIGVKAKDTVKQAGIAAALAAIVAPITAALAFIDPGLAKDENCSALLADAQKEVPPQKTGKTDSAGPSGS